MGGTTDPIGNGMAMSPPGTWRVPEKHLLAALESGWYRTVAGLLATTVRTTHKFYDERRIVPALMPVTVGSVSSPMGLGSDSEPVRTQLFGEWTYLADSMQFQLEYLLRHGADGVFYVMPTFRGEVSDETHLNQFFHSEAEIVGGLEEVLELVEAYVARLSKDILGSDYSAAVEDTAGGLEHLERLAMADSFPRIEFAVAEDLLGGGAFRRVEGVPTISRSGERALIRHFGGVVWLTHPPAAAVPFYQQQDDAGRAVCADLLLGHGEVVGAGARHVGRPETERALAQHRVDPWEYRWYLEMKEHYPLETAGFGLGLERYLLAVLRNDDIRDLQIFPRVAGVPSWV
jgi:asparaginyl-tRNA synthetase